MRVSNRVYILASLYDVANSFNVNFHTITCMTIIFVDINGFLLKNLTNNITYLVSNNYLLTLTLSF